ncbi:MAG: response regulator [Caldimonas sp.]
MPRTESLPLIETSFRPAAATSIEPPFATLRKSTLQRPSELRVLLVDDCPVQLLLGCVLLARWKIVPALAADGLEAVLLAREQEFDLLLMDVEMPVMDGLAATRRIRQHERECHGARRVPVVAYTGSASTLVPREWLDSGMDAVLDKPSSELIMGECLERWCPDKVRGLEQSIP